MRMLRELITTVSIKKFFSLLISHAMLVYQVSNLFSTAAATTLYFIYTALLATYFICLTKFVHPKGIEPPPCWSMTSNGNGNRLVGWIHLKIDLFGVPAFISLLFAITKARASPQMAP